MRAAFREVPLVCGGRGFLGEGSFYLVVSGHVLEGVAGDRAHARAVHLDIGYLIARIGGDGKGLVIAFCDGDGALGVDASARARACGDGPGGYLLEGGLYLVVGSHVLEGVAGDCAHARAIHLDIGYLIARIGSDGKGLVFPMLHRDRAHGIYAPSGSRGGGDGVFDELEGGLYLVVGSHVLEGVAGDRTHGLSVNLDVRYPPARVGGDSEGLVIAFCDLHRSLGVDAAARAHACGDGPGGYLLEGSFYLVVLAHALEGVAGDRTHGLSVHQHVRYPPARVGGDGKGLVLSLGDDDVALGIDAAARARRRRDGPQLGELRLYSVVSVHALEGVGVHRAHGLSVHEHIGYPPARIRRDGEGLVVSLVHPDVALGIDGAALARAGGDVIVVHRDEGDVYGVVLAHALEGVGVERAHGDAVHEHHAHLPAQGRRDHVEDGVIALDDHDVARGVDGAVGSRRRRDGPQLGELRLYGVVSGHILEGVGIDPAHRFPVHQHIEYAEAGIGDDGEGLVLSLGDDAVARGVDGAARARAGGYGEELDEHGIYGVLLTDGGEGVGIDRAHRLPVHQHVQDVVAGIGDDGEVLVLSLGDDDVARGVDGAALARAGGDGPLDAAEQGLYLVVLAHILEGVGVHRAHGLTVHEHIGYAPARIRRDGEGLVASLVHPDVALGVYAAARARRGGDIMDGYRAEGDVYGVVLAHALEGVAGDRAHGDTVHEHHAHLPAQWRRDHVEDGVVAFDDRDVARRIDGAAGTRGGLDRPQCGEHGLYGVILAHALEGVGVDPAHRLPVHQHLAYGAAGIRCNGELLVAAVCDHAIARRVDGAARARRGGDGEELDEHGIYGVLLTDGGEGVGIDRAHRLPVHQHVQDVVAGIGDDGEVLVEAFRHPDVALGIDGAALPGRGGYGPELGELGLYGVVRGHAGEGVGVHRAHARPVHPHVGYAEAGIGDDGEDGCGVLSGLDVSGRGDSASLRSRRRDGPLQQPAGRSAAPYLAALGGVRGADKHAAAEGLEGCEGIVIGVAEPRKRSLRTSDHEDGLPVVAAEARQQQGLTAVLMGLHAQYAEVPSSEPSRGHRGELVPLQAEEAGALSGREGGEGEGVPGRDQGEERGSRVAQLGLSAPNGAGLDESRAHVMRAHVEIAFVDVQRAHADVRRAPEAAARHLAPVAAVVCVQLRSLRSYVDGQVDGGSGGVGAAQGPREGAGIQLAAVGLQRRDADVVGVAEPLRHPGPGAAVVGPDLASGAGQGEGPAAEDAATDVRELGIGGAHVELAIIDLHGLGGGVGAGVVSAGAGAETGRRGPGRALPDPLRPPGAVVAPHLASGHVDRGGIEVALIDREDTDFPVARLAEPGGIHLLPLAGAGIPLPDPGAVHVVLHPYVELALVLGHGEGGNVVGPVEPLVREQVPVAPGVYHRELGVYGVVLGDAAEGIAGGHAHRDAVHQQGGHSVTAVGGDVEGGIMALHDLQCARGRYGSVGARRRRDGPQHGELGMYSMALGDAAEGIGVHHAHGDAVHEHIGDAVAGIRNYLEREVLALQDRDVALGVDRASLARRCGDGEGGYPFEDRLYGVVLAHAGEGVAVDITQRYPVHDDVGYPPGIIGDNSEGLILPVEDRDVALGVDGASLARGRRDGPELGEHGVYGVALDDAAEGVAVHRAHRLSVHQHVFDHVAGVGGEHEGGVVALFDQSVAFRVDGASGARAGRDDVARAEEHGVYGVVGINGVEGVVRARVHVFPIDEQEGEPVAEFRGGVEGLVEALVHLHLARRVDGAAGARGGR